VSQAAWNQEDWKGNRKWSDGPLFALTVLQYLPEEGKILEPGAGVGDEFTVHVERPLRLHKEGYLFSPEGPPWFLWRHGH